jgi:hypothetical protein
MKKILFFIFVFFLMSSVVNAAAPKIRAISDKEVNEGEEIIFEIIALSPDTNDVFFSFMSSPDSLYYLLPNNNNAILGKGSDALRKEFHWIPEVGWAGDYELRFIVSDGTDSSYQDVKITVNGVDHAPDILAIPDKVVVWEDELLFNIPVNHLDIHDTLQFSGNLKIGDSLSSGFNSFPTGVYLNPSSGRFTWTPNVEDNSSGDYYFRFCVTDGNFTDCEYTTISVGENYPPSFIFVPEQLVNEGKELTVRFKLSVLGDLPDGAVFSDNKLLWTPNYDQAGEYSITFNVTDTFGDSYSQDVLIKVLDVAAGVNVSDNVDGSVDLNSASVDVPVDLLVGVIDNAEALNFSIERGLFTGDSGTGDFALDRGINRAELAKVLLSAFSVDLESFLSDSSFSFYDLNFDEWYIYYVYTAFKLGFMTGSSEISMEPSRIVNRVEFLRMLTEISGVELVACDSDLFSDVLMGDWYCKYVNFAVINGLLFGDGFGEFNPGYSMKRGDVVELLYDYYQIFGF